MVGQENQQVRLADTKRDAESYGTRSYQRCRSFPPMLPALLPSNSVVICLRWGDNSLNAHEEFIGLQQVDRIDAATITFTTKDVLHRMNLRLTGARGQCYGGCSKLSGAKTRVATNIKSDEPRTVFTHCYGYCIQ